MTSWESGLLLAGVVVACVASATAQDKPGGALDFTMKSLSGKEANPGRVQGQSRAHGERRQQVRLHAAV
jgi:hypothetical protein